MTMNARKTGKHERIAEMLKNLMTAEPVIDYLAEELKREEKQQRTGLKAIGRAAGR